MSLICTWDHHYYLQALPNGRSGSESVWYWNISNEDFIYRDVPGGIAQLDLDVNPDQLVNLVVSGVNRAGVEIVRYDYRNIFIRPKTADLVKITGQHLHISGEPHVGGMIIIEDIEGIEVANITCNSQGNWFFFLQKNVKAFIRYENRPNRLWFQVPDKEEVTITELEAEYGYWVPHNPV